MSDGFKVATVNSDMTYQYASGAWLESIGWQGDIVGVSLEQVHGSEAVFQLQHAAATARQFGTDTLLWQPDQHRSDLSLQLQIAWNSSAKNWLIHGVSTAATASEQAAKTPQASLFDYTPQAVMVMDRDNRIVKINPSFVTLTGYRFDEVVGEGPGIVTSGDMDPEHFDRLWSQLHSRGSWEGEIWNRHKDGKHYPAWFSITSRRNALGDIEGFVAQFSNIAVLNQDPHMLHQSSFDLVTGLPDLNMALQHLARLQLIAQQMNTEVAVGLLELDDFSELEGKLGPLSTEELLKDVAAILASSLRDEDCVASLDAGRFMLLFSDAPDREVLQQMALRILHQIRDNSSAEMKLNGCIGMALTGENELLPEQLLDQAEQALCHIPEQGVRFQLYSAQMDEAQGAGYISTEDVARALSENEWELRFNPVYSMQGHTLIGAEIEPVWRDSQRGVIPRQDFLSALIRGGKLDEYHLQVGDLLRRFTQVWASFSDFESIHIQLQDEELMTLAFIPGLLRAMFRYEIAPQRLLIHVSVLQALYLRDELDQIRARGVRVLIGGYRQNSNDLVRLPELAPDMLLLDAELVEGQMQDDRCADIVETVLETAQALQIKVLAQGVRTTGQMARLSQQGCYRMCGKYVGRWLTMDQLIERLDMEI